MRRQRRANIHVFDGTTMSSEQPVPDNRRASRALAGNAVIKSTDTVISATAASTTRTKTQAAGIARAMSDFNLFTGNQCRGNAGQG